MRHHREVEISIRAVIEAGKVLVRFFKDKNYRVVYKDEHKRNPVTDADIRSNEIIREKILSAFPEDGWFSEEISKSILDKKRIWIVDPLDGTRNFIKGIPEFAISVALIEDGTPIVGVVYNPYTGELYFADRGEGAYLIKANEEGVVVDLTNLNACVVSKSVSKSLIEEAIVIVSRGEMEKDKFLAKVVEKFRDLKFRRIVSHRIISVVNGWADALVSFSGKNEWDIAGAHIIAEEVGLKVTDSLGEKIFYTGTGVKKKGIIVANELLHAKILKAIRELTEQ